MQRLAQELERFKSRNFSFRGFTPTTLTVGNPTKYTITLVASVSSTSGEEETTSLASAGAGWIMKATPSDVRNYTYLFNSQGVRCRNKKASSVTFTACGGGGGSEKW